MHDHRVPEPTYLRATLKKACFRQGRQIGGLQGRRRHRRPSRIRRRLWAGCWRLCCRRLLRWQRRGLLLGPCRCRYLWARIGEEAVVRVAGLHFLPHPVVQILRSWLLI